nr:putative serine/threonine-protein kinase c70.05c [Quercus suber]
MAGTRTQTQISPPHRRHNSIAMPADPSPPSDHKKGLGFLRRHFHRQRSSVPFPQDAGSPLPPSSLPPPPTSPTPIIRRTSAAPPTEDETIQPRPSQPVEDADQAMLRPTSHGSEAATTPDDLKRSRSKGSRNGVRWAEGFEEQLKPTPRRLSSATSTRRSSIYARDADGKYRQGVDHGVGTKARRLSVQIPDSIEVDEAPLEDHFSIFARASKKNIGEGGAAVVQQMSSKTAGRTGKEKVFAVKEFREWDEAAETEWEYQRKIKSEYAIAKSCEHPNIVETYRLLYSNNHSSWYHVMEFCDQGDINDIINKNFFSREDRNCMFKQLLRGVDYLHARGIAHRDIKSENLLLTQTGCLKIADFGTSEVFSGAHPGARGCRRPSLIEDDAEIHLCKPGLVGSRPYMAPELLKREESYDPRAVDVWSCAIVYITLIVGGTPWECASGDVNNFNIYCSTWDKYQELYPDGLIKEDRSLPVFSQTKEFRSIEDPLAIRLIFAMLHPDPCHRMSIRDALDSKVVKEFACCQQDGYSDDIRTRQRKALHNHCPQKKTKGFGSPKSW